jgi:hypothetical protein
LPYPPVDISTYEKFRYQPFSLVFLCPAPPYKFILDGGRDITIGLNIS